MMTTRIIITLAAYIGALFIANVFKVDTVSMLAIMAFVVAIDTKVHNYLMQRYLEKVLGNVTFTDMEKEDSDDDRSSNR